MSWWEDFTNAFSMGVGTARGNNGRSGIPRISMPESSRNPRTDGLAITHSEISEVETILESGNVSDELLSSLKAKSEKADEEANRLEQAEAYIYKILSAEEKANNSKYNILTAELQAVDTQLPRIFEYLKAVKNSEVTRDALEQEYALHAGVSDNTIKEQRDAYRHQYQLIEEQRQQRIKERQQRENSLNGYSSSQEKQALFN
jgi:hypothetical protein